MQKATTSPVYVIAGFLGSGKTTLLKRVLAHELEKGVKPAVLMNEFGEVDVDGALLQEHSRSKDIQLQSLLSGCICCDLSGEFSEKVGHLMKETKGAPLFIETTGLADTGQVVMGVEQALAAQAGGSARGALASVVVLVDAPRFMKLGIYWSAAEDHLKQADTVVLNKLDQVGDRQADLLECRVQTVNPTARIVRAVHADVDVQKLFSPSRNARPPLMAERERKSSVADYQSRSFKILRSIDADCLEAWLTRFQRSVIRLKGYVRVHGRNGLQELQWIMGRLAITPYHGEKQSQAKIVVIGRRVPWERFLKGLEECLVRPRRQTKRWSRARRKRS